MHKIFSSRNLVILVICLVLSIGLIGGTAAIRDKKGTPTFIQMIGNDVAGLGQRIVSVPANGVEKIFGSTKDLINTYHENNYLKSKVQKVQATDVRNHALNKENQQLKQQLDLNKTLTGYTKVNAAVMSRTPSNWQQQLIINKGSMAGIKKNMSVIVNKGLVGRISEVNKTNSKVELITDSGDSASSFAVQVDDKKTPVSGLISGYNNAKNELEMGSLTSKGKIKRGSKVMTSGLGGVTPQGLFVGTVTGVSGTANGISEQINIKPAADTRNIDVVTVVGKD
ncbi:rod shape-determining protein MreC [Fructilactobacillus lindneri]|uniref:Cell shape-determining protein MreC n=1 Tax=Fructilactobacillus lindneri TaxID=53444 RepID=A0AB33BD24_9LACO|nr:rod shape-determining protein MreC [Fructilactobacillus lindneri]ANZ58347.1 rod shape-determining protein MreC [Fructilactobacillus lindneri]ANZ59669.1 rod shape-determining protein MreC [Fructilactobacillus lindneri]POG98548.1 rod shape-determining protein MreC [Fructilactobacillus lindneri]POH03936.1 rod shape-determining protein MreC [Fructilactobacillus lindneri]POH04821.1 rod shape-determining protein MreC [Fructilactobacillus lindneri]